MLYTHGAGGSFAKRDNSILVYTPNFWRADIEFNRLYTVYVLKGTLSKFMKQNLCSAYH